MSEILAYFLNDNHAQMLRNLEEFVTRETPTMDKTRTDDFAGFLADYARGLGGEVEILPAKGRGNHVCASWGEKSGEKPILLLGHFDTVWPAGTLERMQFRIEDGGTRPWYLRYEGGSRAGLLGRAGAARGDRHGQAHRLLLQLG